MRTQETVKQAIFVKWGLNRLKSIPATEDVRKTVFRKEKNYEQFERQARKSIYHTMNEFLNRYLHEINDLSISFEVLVGEKGKPLYFLSFTIDELKEFVNNGGMKPSEVRPEDDNFTTGFHPDAGKPCLRFVKNKLIEEAKKSPDRLKKINPLLCKSLSGLTRLKEELSVENNGFVAELIYTYCYGGENIGLKDKRSHIEHLDVFQQDEKQVEIKMETGFITCFSVSCFDKIVSNDSVLAGEKVFPLPEAKNKMIKAIQARLIK